jgi:hypothetical protein
VAEIYTATRGVDLAPQHARPGRRDLHPLVALVAGLGPDDDAAVGSDVRLRFVIVYWMTRQAE